MPFTPTKLKNRHKKIAFTFCGEQVNVEYLPGVLSRDGFADESMQVRTNILEAQNSSDKDAQDQAMLVFGAWLCQFLVSWDFLEDDNATMQPITPENIALLMRDFGDFLFAVMTEITEDYNGGNANGAS